MFLGVDIGGTNTKAVLVDADHRLLVSMSNPSIVENAEGLAHSVRGFLEALCTQAHLDARDLQGCGLSMPGIVDKSTGDVVFAPNIQWRERTQAVSVVENTLGVGCAIENDAVCAGIAEAHTGAGISAESMLLFTLGTGVGVSYIVGGAPFEGWGAYGGEMGHIPLHHGKIPCSCGTPGCFQQCASAVALGHLGEEFAVTYPESELAALYKDTKALGAEDIFNLTHKGDTVSQQVLETYYTYLAEGIGGLINIFRPELVVLGGGLVAAQPQVAREVEHILPAHVYASDVVGYPKVARAVHGTYAGALGAALIAVQKFGAETNQDNVS